MKAYTPEIEDEMKKFYQTLPEKDRRHQAAVEALKLGHGDPLNAALGWTNLSPQALANRLADRDGVRVGKKGDPTLACQRGLSSASGTKKQAMKARPARNEQFENSPRLKAGYARPGQPIISMDTKKKELLGNF
jgi:hypothetical protein